MATFYTGNTGRSRGPHLDFRVWDVEKGGYVDPTPHLSRLQSDGKAIIEQFEMTSPYGADRGSYIHKGVDYATPVGTAINVVGGKFIGTTNDAGGGISSQYGVVDDAGRKFDYILMHGNDQNALTMDGFNHNFDYSTINNAGKDGSSSATDLDMAPVDSNSDSVKERIEAKERVQEFITRQRTAAEVVNSFGNDFGKMKSSRLGAALAGAQEDIVSKRMSEGMNPGMIRVLKEEEDG
ncbi:MAG: hypothetical protein CL681_06110 [Blastopirellula sp.]|nr:hypothetical protein [Blastopirellula sp.]